MASVVGLAIDVPSRDVGEGVASGVCPHAETRRNKTVRNKILLDFINLFSLL
jgi:hypothetical protein